MQAHGQWDRGERGTWDVGRSPARSEMPVALLCAVILVAQREFGEVLYACNGHLTMDLV
jgi:hypothetical protein